MTHTNSITIQITKIYLAIQNNALHTYLYRHTQTRGTVNHTTRHMPVVQINHGAMGALPVLLHALHACSLLLVSTRSRVMCVHLCNHHYNASFQSLVPRTEPLQLQVPPVHCNFLRSFNSNYTQLVLYDIILLSTKTCYESYSAFHLFSIVCRCSAAPRWALTVRPDSSNSHGGFR